MKNHRGRGIDATRPHRHSRIMSKKIKTSAFKSAAALFCAAALLPAPRSQAYPVSDAGTHSGLFKLNGTASSILAQAQQINANTAVIKDNTTQIMTDTRDNLVPDVEEIRQDVDIIQKDIEVMRKIGEARQLLTHRINQLQELTTKGNVFKQDPFANAVASGGVSDGNSIYKILEEMGQYMKEPDDASNIPDASTLDGVTTDVMRTNSTPQGQAPAYYFKAADGTELNTFVTPEEAGTKAGIDNAFESLLSLSYAPEGGSKVGFTGKGAAFLQAMIGLGGRPLGMDHIPPVGRVLLSDAQKDRLRRMQNGSSTDDLSSLLQKHIRENYRQASMEGKNPWEIIPGVFVRPKTEADSLFEEMVIGPNATAGSQVAFYAAAAVYGNSQYDPCWGFSPKAEYTLPVNVNNMLSKGAYEAVEDYNRKHGGGSNPYANFGKSIAPVIAEIVGKTQAGQNLVITKADLDRASSMESVGFKSAPKTPQAWVDMFARSEKAEADYIRAAASATATPASEDLFVLFGLNKRDTKIYGTKIMANSTRLSQNNKTLLTQVCLMEYNKNALKAVVDLVDALEQLGKSTSEKNIVEMLPVFRDNAQNQILVLQNRIGQLQAQVDDLLKERHEALAERQKTIEEYQKLIEENSKGQVEQILIRLSPVNVDI